MNADELLRRIIAFGADEKGIADRFCGNADLYESCFLDFMEEPSFIALRDAIHTQNYEQAFAAAHALKGLSGNLGVTGFYDAIRTLTNSLRNAQYDNIYEEYAEVERQHERLKRVMTAAPKQEPAEAAPDAPAPRRHFKKLRARLQDRTSRLLLYMMCVSVAAIVFIAIMFLRMNAIHERNVMEESGQHLTELSQQIKLYIEDNIATDWRIAQSVGDSILSSAYVDDDPAVFEMLQKKQEVWGISDLMLYTENGYCIHADGSTEATDVASMTVYDARKKGKSLSVLDSQLIYTVPLSTTLTFKGSPIVAVSAVRDMSSFLDEMDFSSFSGAAWMYLTYQGGVLVSSLSNPSTVQAFNMQAIIKDMDITALDACHTEEDMLTCPHTAVFMLSDASGKAYVVSTPVLTDAEPMRLFYFVPVNVVNNVMGGFSRQLTAFSLATVFLFAVCAYCAFMFVYKSRKKCLTAPYSTASGCLTCW